MDNIHNQISNQQDIVYLTPSEKEQLEDYVEKMMNARTFAEAKIYDRNIKALIAKGKSRK